MIPASDIKFFEWQPMTSFPWETQTASFITQIDVTAIANGFIDKHVNRRETPRRLVDCYRSYLIQTLKDIDYAVGIQRSGSGDLECIKQGAVDLSLSRAQPWRFTAYALNNIQLHWDAEIIRSLPIEELWLSIKPLLEEAFEQGALFRIDRFTKVSHVLLDISFDIGWDLRYKSVSPLKEIEGITGSPERAAMLRDVSLYIARDFWRRGLMNAAKHIMLIGFADIPDVISELNEIDMQHVLIENNAPQAVRLLLGDKLALQTKSLNINLIAQGALSWLGEGTNS